MVAVAVGVGVTVAVAVTVTVGVGVRVVVMVGVAVDVSVTVGVGVVVVVGVPVTVAVAVAVGVGVRVDVGVGVAVGVGGVPFAAPFRANETAALPLVALLATNTESWKVPAVRGANRTLTTSGDPFGSSIDWPAPRVTAKLNEVVFPIVTVSGAVPMF